MSELLRKIRYWLAYLIAPEWIDDLEDRFSAFLCDQTGGKMSKCYYTYEAMRSVANDHLQDVCAECEADAVKEFAEEVKAVFFEGDTATQQAIDNLVKEKVGE